MKRVSAAKRKRQLEREKQAVEKAKRAAHAYFAEIEKLEGRTSSPTLKDVLRWTELFYSSPGFDKDPADTLNELKAPITSRHLAMFGHSGVGLIHFHSPGSNILLSDVGQMHTLSVAPPLAGGMVIGGEGMDLRAIHQKIARLDAGGKPRILDLFAGCGGLSLGFIAAAAGSDRQ